MITYRFRNEEVDLVSVWVDDEAYDSIDVVPYAEIRLPDGREITVNACSLTPDPSRLLSGDETE